MGIKHRRDSVQLALVSVGWLYMAGIFLFLLLPILVLIMYSFEQSRFATWPLTGFTWRWYEEIFFGDGQDLFEALKHSLIISPLAATTACTISFFAAYVLNRFNFRGKALIAIMLIIPILIPPLILGIAFLGLLSRINLHGHLYSILIAHIVILIPPSLAVISLRLAQMPESIEEASWDLGATEWQTIWRVVLPWALPGIAGGWLLAFNFSFDEFAIAWFVSGFDRTLPVSIFNYMAAHLDPSLNAIGSIIFVVSVLLLVGVEVLLLPMLLNRRSSS